MAMEAKCSKSTIGTCRKNSNASGRPGAFTKTEATEGAELLVVAFCSVAAFAKTAIRKPGTRRACWFACAQLPCGTFPGRHRTARGPLCGRLVVEMNAGQMIEDVRLAVKGLAPVHFLWPSWRYGPMPDEILDSHPGIE